MTIGSKVILKTTEYDDDKYNPRELVGVVYSIKRGDSPIKVKWSNGIINAYYANDLEIVIEN